ncbi:hypothetical protein BVZ23_08800 [Klebsiella variicola]|nr:hypothetical protein BVZ23_08800 [Klebsiella variicola]
MGFTDEFFLHSQIGRMDGEKIRINVTYWLMIYWIQPSVWIKNSKVSPHLAIESVFFTKVNL